MIETAKEVTDEALVQKLKPNPIMLDDRYLKVRMKSVITQIVERGVVFIDEITVLLSNKISTNRYLLKTAVGDLRAFFHSHGVSIVSGKGERQKRGEVPAIVIERSPMKSYGFKHAGLSSEFRDMDDHLSAAECDDLERTFRGNLTQRYACAAPELYELFNLERRRFRRLTHEEVVELSSRVQQLGDLDARNTLVEHNLGLVISVASHYAYRFSHLADTLDFVQEGMFGLIRAAEKFDPARGYQFSTYALWWIKQAVSRYVDDHCHTIRIPVHMQVLIRRVGAVSSAYLRDHGQLPTSEQMATMLNLAVSRVERVMLYLSDGDAKSLEELSHPGDLEDEGQALTVASSMSDRDSMAPRYNIEAKEAIALSMAKINEVLAMISFLNVDLKWELIFRQRYGIDNSLNKRTLEEIGQDYGVTRERIRQIVENVWEKLGAIGCQYEDETFREELVRISRLESLIGKEVSFPGRELKVA